MLGDGSGADPGAERRVGLERGTDGWWRGSAGGVAAGSVVADAPALGADGWAAATDVGLSWAYRLTDGALPPGLALDPATGAISGTPTTAGSFSATIEGVLTNPAKPATAWTLPIPATSFTPPVATYALTVTP